jgi:hypothetical protein
LNRFPLRVGEGKVQRAVLRDRAANVRARLRNSVQRKNVAFVGAPLNAAPVEINEFFVWVKVRPRHWLRVVASFFARKLDIIAVHKPVFHLLALGDQYAYLLAILHAKSLEPLNLVRCIPQGIGHRALRLDSALKPYGEVFACLECGDHAESGGVVVHVASCGGSGRSIQCEAPHAP